MQWAIDRGKTVYDFMRGREHYKYEFGATDVPNWTVIAYPTGAAATAVRHRLDVVAQALRRRARREIDALLRVGRKHGWFSFALLEHLSAAFGKGLADVLVRLRGRRPEPRRG